MKPVKHKLIAAVLASLWIASCHGGPKMEIELDAFSGRPNPRWETTSPLQKKLDSLSEKTKPAPEPGLGYRGFIIHHGDKSVRVFSGRVTMERDGKSQTYRDTAGLEAELAKQARQYGHAGIVPDL